MNKKAALATINMQRGFMNGADGIVTNNINVVFCKFLASSKRKAENVRLSLFD
jgi:DNA topoisomerase VI subunit B